MEQFLADGNTKWTTNLENSLAVYLKSKYATTIWSSNRMPGHFSWRNDDSSLPKNLSTNVYSSFMHNSPNPEMIRCSSESDWLNCGIVMSWNTILQQKRRKYWYKQQPGWKSRELCWMKRVNSKRSHIVWFHVHTFWKWQNFRNEEQTSGFQ